VAVRTEGGAWDFVWRSEVEAAEEDSRLMITVDIEHTLERLKEVEEAVEVKGTGAEEAAGTETEEASGTEVEEAAGT